ncbi:acyltransferase [Natrinema sp. SYSU A 869]|uniref:acyltransferase family protein n=1 Tax=Natrinema sp. SYSU A 869 TaxID=2871694 RepID=UPI00210825D8|nr:acyltransferase [Natrinema sp. SYSU A 869]
MYGNMANFVLETTARFAVPFFFMASGYFFALKTTRGDPTDYLIKRVTSITSLYAFGLVLSAPVFLAGTIVRASAENRAITSSVVLKVAEFVSPIELLYYGTSVSEILWFLPALIFSYVLIYLCIASTMSAYLLPISLGFHLVGLLGSGYTMFVDIPFEIRSALFFGFFYTSLGYYIYSHEWQPAPERSTLYLGTTILFGVLHIGERYVLGYAITDQTVSQGIYAPSYTIATALVTLSLFVFLLSRPNLGRDTALPVWGKKYAVGIYVTHPPVLFILEKAGESLSLFGHEIQNTILWHLVLTPATFAGALLVYLSVRNLRAIEIDGFSLPRSRQIRNK